MAQQINLCTPILLTQKRYFSAATMVQALAVFVVLGGGLAAYWVSGIRAASEGLNVALARQAQELAGLQNAMAQTRASSGPAPAALGQELQIRQNELRQREKLLAELQRGLFRPGWGHSARLQLVAQTIPAKVWLTEVSSDDGRLEVSGFTLEPPALNEWVGKLAQSPLLAGQSLAAIKVESARNTSAPVPVWSFSLVSAAARSSVEGAKP
jgi:Tfp pilus assembly protein PilN